MFVALSLFPSFSLLTHTPTRLSLFSESPLLISLVFIKQTFNIESVRTWSRCIYMLDIYLNASHGSQIPQVSGILVALHLLSHVHRQLAEIVVSRTRDHFKRCPGCVFKSGVAHLLQCSISAFQLEHFKAPRQPLGRQEP